MRFIEFTCIDRISLTGLFTGLRVAEICGYKVILKVLYAHFISILTRWIWLLQSRWRVLRTGWLHLCLILCKNENLVQVSACDMFFMRLQVLLGYM